MQIHHPTALAAALTACLALAGHNAIAQTVDRTWDGTGNGIGWSDNANWTPADRPDSTTENAIIDAGGAFNVQLDLNTSVAALTVGSDDTLTFPNDRDLNVHDGITNNGTINLNNTGSGETILTFNGSQTLGGSGELVLNDSTRNDIRMGNAGDILTHGADHTIRGAGELLPSFGDMGLINHGTIIAEGANRLTIDPGAVGVTNHGLFQGNGTGGLRLENGTVTNHNLIKALAGSNVDVANATIVGGTLETSGSGRIFANHRSTFDGVTIAAGSVVDQNDDDDVTIRNGLTNHGTWKLNHPDTSGNTILTFDGSQTLGGTGELVLSDNIRNDIRMGEGQTLTHGPDHTIRGAGELLPGFANMNLINQGTILAQGANFLRIEPRDGTLTNQGTIRAEGTGGLEFRNGNYVNTGHTIEVDPDSKLNVLSGATIVGGTLQSSGSGRIFANHQSTFDGVTIAAGSVVNQNDSDWVTIRNGLTNHGTWNLNHPDDSGETVLIFDGSQTLGGTGEMVLSDSRRNDIRMGGVDQTLTHGADHTIRGAGELLPGFNNMSLDNFGTILAEGSSRLRINATGTVTNRAGGVFGGDGIFEINNTSLQNEGTLAPGASAGTLTVIGDIVNSDTAKLLIELGGAGSGEFDVLNVSGDFNLDGTLEVALIDGFVPTPTDSFTILNATRLLGSAFDNADPGGDNLAEGITTGGVTFDVVYDFANDTVTLTNVVPEPGTLALLTAGVGLIARPRRRR